MELPKNRSWRVRAMAASGLLVIAATLMQLRVPEGSLAPRNPAKRIPPAQTTSVTAFARMEVFEAAPTRERDEFASSEHETLLRVAHLANERDPSAEDALIEIVRHGATGDSREAASRALDRSQSDAALDTWIAALRDPDEWVKDSAETALFRFADRARVHAKLESALVDPDREARLAAALFADELIEGRLPWHEIYAGPTRIQLNP